MIRIDDWLVVWTPLKNMSSSVEMMKFPTEWQVIKSHLWNHQAVMVKSMVSGVSFPKQSIDPLTIAKLHTSRGPLWSRAGVPPNDPYLHRRKVITWDHTSKNWTDLNSSWFILIHLNSIYFMTSLQIAWNQTELISGHCQHEPGSMTPEPLWVSKHPWEHPPSTATAHLSDTAVLHVLTAVVPMQPDVRSA
jgi:hypothetical protein